MTIVEIKAKLPDVKIKIHGEVFTGQLAGRSEKFPHVFTNTPVGQFVHEFSWEAIQHSISHKTPLIAD